MWKILNSRRSCCSTSAINGMICGTMKLQYWQPEVFRKALSLSLYETLQRMVASSVQLSSVAQSCPTLGDPMNHSMPGLPVYHKLPESTQTHVDWFGDAIQSSHPLSSPSHPALNHSQHHSPCSPRDSQESSPTPQFKSSNSSVLSFLHSPTLTSIYDYWKNHSLD